ncbi:CHAT domain-containing protein [Streptomyces sp. NPDC006365]|uniref:CHAT domain-containing protein n=1 Tax=Streptomyces sp. NPDC006365 TaxID=3364744 RepID=UPI00368E64E9
MTEVTLEALLHLATAQPLLDPGAATRAVSAHPVVARAAQHIGQVEKQYDEDGDPSRLKEARWIFEKLLGHPAWADEWAYGRALLLAKVSEMTLESFQLTGDERELRRAGELAHQAVDAGRRCVSLMGSEDDARAAFGTLVQRHATTPAAEPPDELIAAMRDERRILASVLPTALHALGGQLTVAFDHGAEHAVIDEAVTVLTEAESSSAAAAQGPPDRSTSCVRLTAALLLRFKHYGDPADAVAMVDVARRAVAHDRSAAALDALGCCLIARAELPGHQQDAAEAVEVLEEAVRQTPGSPWVRGNLAVALAGRYRLHGVVQDAERSLALTESAMADIPSSAPDLARLQQNAMGMQEVLRKPRPAIAPKGPAEPDSGTDSGVEAARRLLAITPAEARSRPARLGSLAHSLCKQAEQTLDLKVLAEAVETAQQGVTAAPEQSADRAHVYGALGRALTLRYCLLGRAADLTEAESAAREAVATAPPAERAEWLLGLASVLSLRAARPDSAADATDTASRTFRDAAEAAELQPSVRLRVCRTWGLWAAERAAWPESAQALTQALDAADRLYRIQTARPHREMSLGQAPALHADAAVSLVGTNDTEGALRALEHGRARLLADALACDRSALDRLRDAGHPDLADAFHASGVRLADLEKLFTTQGRAATDPDALKRQRAAQDAQHDIVRRIRQVPGFTQFLAAPDVEDVRAAARNRPLLYLAAGAHGAIALAVDQAGRITARPLVGVDADQVSLHAAELASAQYTRSIDPERWRRVLDRVTRWLGEALFVPILDLLPRDGVLAIVPYGLLALLPLHAARLPDVVPPDPQGVSRPHFVVDVCALTVAPSARVLAACSALAARRVESDTLLTVDVGERKDMPPLPHATDEARDVLALWGRGQRLSGEAATAARVRAALPEHHVLHFACHGRSDVFAPLSGTLYLTGTDTVTVRDLLDTRGLQARLAVLSACQTAVIGTQLPEEAIGLPAAMIQAGTAGVVGTLWEIQDVASSLLVRRFFDLWRTGEEPAQALRVAQRWLRDTTNGEKRDAYPGLTALQPPSDTSLEAGWRAARSHAAPDYWAAFTYTGW